MNTIIVGIDGSPSSGEALGWAIEEACLRNAKVVALMAWDYLNQPHRPNEDSFDPDFDAARAQAFLDELVTDVLREVNRNTDLDPAAVEVERRVVLGLPAKVLLEAAADTDLVVVGRRGLGGFKGMLLGSVSQHVVQHAPCPVVVHRATSD